MEGVHFAYGETKVYQGIDLEVVGLPATVFVDADGRILGRHAGALTEAQLLSEIEERYAIRP